MPFEVVTLANNHADSGTEGFLKQVVTRKLGIRIARPLVGKERPPLFLPLEVNGVKIALFNFSEGEDESAALGGKAGVHGWQPEKVAEMIGQKRENFAVIIVIAHCGLEYIPFPPPYVFKAFQRLADAGADLVIGHHPHVPQGVCIRNQVPMCFSLGNFAFYQETDLKFRKLWLFAESWGWPSRPAQWKSFPTPIKDLGLSRLRDAQLDEFTGLFQLLSQPLTGGDAEVQAAWHGFLAYYGEAGYRQEVERIMREWEKTPAKGAAMLRNRLLTLQHYWHWRDGLTRIIEGSIGQAKKEYIYLAQRFFTEKLQ